MLKLLRNKKTAKKIWIGLAVIIIISFVFFGFEDVFGNKNKKGYIGKISGKKITTAEFNDSLNAVRNTAIMQFGDNLEQIEKSLNLEAQAWQRIALLETAKKLKIKVSDQEVVTQVENYPFFKRNGVFDSKIYNELLKYVFHTPARTFEEQTRQNLMISKLYSKITDDIKVDDKEIKDRYIKVQTINNPKFKIDDKKFLGEKKEYGKIALEEKKQEVFSKYMAGLLK